MITADILIESLKLIPHPEGGFYKENYRSKEKVSNLPERFQGQSRNLGTSIFYLLKGDQYSAFHKIQSDEIWHFYEGSPLELYVLDENGMLKTYVLGNNLNNGGTYQVIIKHNQWFAAKPVNPKSFTFVGCTVSPGFDFSDFQLAKRNELLEKYPQHHSVIMKFTRE
jgi:predicted cupin superfamily sugar epimerase